MKPLIVVIAASICLCLPAHAKKSKASVARWLSVEPVAAAAMNDGRINRFSDALVHVWETHPDVLQAQYALQATGFDLTAAYSGFLPYAQLDLARSRRSDRYIARFIQPLFSGGSTVAGVQAAQASQRQALTELSSRRLQLALRLNDVWFGWLAARELDQLYVGHIADLNNLLGIIRRRADEGVAAQADVINAITRIRQVEAQTEANRAVLGATQAQLTALLGTRSLGQPSWPEPMQRLDDAVAAKAWEHARDKHPSIQFALAGIERQTAERNINRGRTMPELGLRYNKPFGDEADISAPTSEIYMQYQTDTVFRAFQGMRAGSSRVEAAQASLENARRDVQAAINQASAERQAAALQLEYQQLAFQAARDLVDSFKRQFETGRKTWIEVLNAQREAQETRLQLVQQRRAYWVANNRLALQGVYWEVLLRELDDRKLGALK